VRIDTYPDVDPLKAGAVAIKRRRKKEKKGE
jgi:hypothetical protein